MFAIVELIDMFSVVNAYLDHLKFCVVCIIGRRYVCCSECDVVSNGCNESTFCLVQPIGMHGGEVMYFGCVCFRSELCFLLFYPSYIYPMHPPFYGYFFGENRLRCVLMKTIIFDGLRNNCGTMISR